MTAFTKWKHEEIQFLKDNFERMTVEEIGLRLNRTRKATQTKATEIGLRHPAWKISAKGRRTRMLNRMKFVEAPKPVEKAQEIPKEWLAGMIQAAPGHVYSAESYALRMRAYGKTFSPSETAF